MRFLRLLLTAVLGALGLLVLAPGPALACSCAALATTEKVAIADVVVIGTVTDVTMPSGSLLSDDLARYDVAVDRVLKGQAAAAATVLSPASGASCGLEGVRAGRRYVVLAARTEAGELEANLCGGTGPATSALVAEVESVTGSGGPPDPPAAYRSTLTMSFDDPAGDPATAAAFAVATAGAFLLVTGGLWLRMRRA